MVSKSKKYYDSNPKAKAKKKKYDSKEQKKRAKNPRLKVKSDKTGKDIQYKSDLKNKERDAKKKGINTSEMDYDHTTKKHIPKSKNRGNKKSIVFSNSKKSRKK